ncbi:unnamed protein product [Rotaria sp. Silwood2]|nr:unnamed protein product [Rotaria sp. Silwood2]
MILTVANHSAMIVCSDDAVIIYPSTYNKQKVQQTINSVTDHTTILIKPGIYTESLVIEYKFVSIIAQNLDQVVEFQPLLNNIAILHRNGGGGGQVKGIVFTGKTATGISGSRNDQEKPSGMIEISNCTFIDIGNGVINRFTHISIVRVSVSRAQWFSIELRSLVKDLITTVHDTFLLDSGNELILHETDDIFISNLFVVIVRDSLIRNARPKSDGTYSDGFVAMKNKEPIELRTSAVYNNYRAGISVWGGRLIVINNCLRGHKFDLNYETFDDISGNLEGSTGNVCFDYPPRYICAAVSSVLEPSRLISPTR